jgi:Tetratricopeptide repeat
MISKTTCELMNALCMNGLMIPNDRAGHAMYVLGNVRIREGALDEAFALHRRSLKCFEATYGLSHHKTGNARLKVAWHLARVGEYEEALYAIFLRPQT